MQDLCKIIMDAMSLFWYLLAPTRIIKHANMNDTSDMKVLKYLQIVDDFFAKVILNENSFIMEDQFDKF